MGASVADCRSIRSVMCAPLCDVNGTAFGVIQLDTQDRSSKVTEEDLKLLVGVTSGRAAVDRAADPLETRGSVVAERGRFRVRERTVLRYYARTIEPLLATPGRTH